MPQPIFSSTTARSRNNYRGLFFVVFTVVAVLLLLDPRRLFDSSVPSSKLQKDARRSGRPQARRQATVRVVEQSTVTKDEGHEPVANTTTSIPVAGTATTTIMFDDISVQNGTIRIQMLPGFGNSSSEFFAYAAQNNCRGTLYRSEPKFLIQGRVSCPSAPTVVKGECPAGMTVDPKRACPSNDPDCGGCHGPIMERGMVGWAGGQTGPDFFIYTGDIPYIYFGHDHTVIGQVDAGDAVSWATIMLIESLPSKTNGVMHLLLSDIPLRVLG